MCTIAVCGLAHMIEAEGIASVVVGLIPQHVATMRPPRALLVPFELGRPFGVPGDADLQRRVMDEAVSLFDAPGPAPIARELDVDLPPATNEPAWVCPVSFPEHVGETPAERLGEEVRLLRPWFDQARKARGHSSADASELSIDERCTWLARFLEDPTPVDSPVPDRSLSETFKLAVEDLKAYYLEALTAQPGGTASRPVNDWFWDESEAGALLWTLRERLKDHPDEGVRLHAAFTLVPEAQVARRERG